MRGIDFSSWQSLLATLIGLALFTLISIGIRPTMMFTIQQRRERMNRQINERLRTLIAAYKTLGGSFTGNLTVDPTHLGDLHRQDQASYRLEEQKLKMRIRKLNAVRVRTANAVSATRSRLPCRTSSCSGQRSKSV